MKLHPVARLSVCPLLGDYLDLGLSMMTGVKIRSLLPGYPPNALFYEKDNSDLVWYINIYEGIFWKKCLFLFRSWNLKDPHDSLPHCDLIIYIFKLNLLG